MNKRDTSIDKIRALRDEALKDLYEIADEECAPDKVSDKLCAITARIRTIVTLEEIHRDEEVTMYVDPRRERYKKALLAAADEVTRTGKEVRVEDFLE